VFAAPLATGFALHVRTDAIALVVIEVVLAEPVLAARARFHDLMLRH